MDRLPLEVLLLIKEQIDDIHTLQNLILCSRWLHNFFLPFLYDSEFVDLEYFSQRHPSNTFQKVIIPLIHNICRHRVVARSFYQLTCVASGFGFDTSSDATSVDPDVVLDHSLIKSVLDEICDTEQEKSKWMSHLAAANQDAWTGLLLTRLFNLEIIHISAPDEDSYFVQQIICKAARRESPFDQRPLLPLLREVKMGIYEEDNFTSGYLTLPFCYFPSVQKIITKQIKDRVGKKPVFDVSGTICPTSPVTEIRVIGCLNIDGLDKWIAACNNLETFKLAFGFLDGDIDLWKFDAHELRNSLLQVNKTLKTLCLDLDNVYYDARYQYDKVAYYEEPWELGMEKGDQPFGSLKEFLALQTLCIRHANLMRLRHLRHELGVPLRDLLPRSLENLHIIDIHPDYLRTLLKELTRLVYEHEHFVPLLKNLRLDRWTSYRWRGPIEKDLKDWMGPLQEACHKNGINLQIADECTNCADMQT